MSGPRSSRASLMTETHQYVAKV